MKNYIAEQKISPINKELLNIYAYVHSSKYTIINNFCSFQTVTHITK
jgi:hypothetical protein